MNCKTVQQSFNEYLDSSLDSNTLARMDTHLGECEHCSSLFVYEQQFRDSLKELPVIGPSADFTNTVFANLDVKKNVGHRSGFIKGFSTAIAAGLALWVVVGLLPFNKQPTIDNPVHTVSINLHEVKTVSLAFNAVSAVKNAKVTLRLPGNMELAGYEGIKELSWSTSLKKGDNLLKLPVRANAIAQGKIYAEVEYQDKLKTFSFDIQVKQSGANMEPFRSNVV